MVLPQNVQEKINNMISSQRLSELKEVQKSLTDKYKTKSGKGNSLIDSKKDSLIYAFSRMPATFAVIYSLLNQLNEQELLKDFHSVIDMGSGTGAGYFAIKEFDKNIEISLFERDKNMIDIFNQFETGKVVQKFDLVKDESDKKADLVISSYILSEISDEQRMLAASKLFDMTNKYLLIVDTGTPKVWKQMMEIKKSLEKHGANVLAPCRANECDLQNDYCQFYARVERSAVHKQVKEGSLSYEDEKYFYLLFSKNNIQGNEKNRVIRRPIIKTNITTLSLCTKDGVVQKDFSKRQKEEYKKAKKAKINDLL